jgi:hypothetical protein
MKVRRGFFSMSGKEGIMIVGKFPRLHPAKGNIIDV